MYGISGSVSSRPVSFASRFIFFCSSFAASSAGMTLSPRYSARAYNGRPAKGSAAGAAAFWAFGSGGAGATRVRFSTPGILKFAPRWSVKFLGLLVFAFSEIAVWDESAIGDLFAHCATYSRDIYV